LESLPNTRLYLAIIVTIVGFSILITNANDAFAETLEWESEFQAGILPTEPTEFDINLKVSTHSKNALQLDWNEPNVSNNLVVVGYKIMRKTIDTEYNILVENTYSTETSYIDDELSKNYYGYKIIPITESKKPEPISKHGIDRNHSMFDVYCKGQELLAKKTLDRMLNDKLKYYDSLKEPITIIYNPIKRVDDFELQQRITNEKYDAYQLFKNLFDVEQNH